MVLAVAFLAPALLFGQGDARIWGTVTDTTGAMVPGADVAITREGTNNVRRTQTNAAGQFAATQLEPGRYRVDVQAAGFKKTTQSGLELRVGDSVEI